MQSGSLPTWVTIVVAVLGIVGLVVAQLVNAWREDRRIKNDREREDVRWAREAADRQAQRDHDARLHWSERRLDAYATVIETFQHWGAVVDRIMVDVLQEGPRKLAPADLLSAQMNLREAIARVRLVGSLQADAKATEVAGIGGKIWPLIYGDGVDVEDIEAIRHEIEHVAEGLREIFRADLGVASGLDTTH